VIKGRSDSLDETNEEDLVYEVKQTDVIFDRKPCTLTILRDVSEIVRAEHTRAT
jgi:hypothetical protein